MKSVTCCILFFVFAISIKAQDVLYTTGGNKIQAKVTELNPTDIKYKDFSNLDGPTYVIARNEIVLIQFSDGTTQIINENAPAFAPTAAEPYTVKPIEKKKKLNLYYLNKNLVSINAMALANGDLTIIYDRELLDSRLCLSFLGGYNFNSRMGALNAAIINGLGFAKKKYDAGLGISFMPRNTKRVQYFVGLLGKYMSFNFEDNTLVNGQSVITTKQGSQLAIMISNGWVFRITPNFNFKFFGSLGLPSYSGTSGTNSPTYVPKMYLGYCFGYRF